MTYGVLSLALSAHAQTPEAPTAELTLGQAIAAALAGNPELRASEFELRASEGRLQQAGLRPNPELGLELENFAGSGDTSGTDVLETTLTLSQVIELGGKREWRQQLAGAQHVALTTERRISQLDILAKVTHRYLDVVMAQEQLALGQTALKIAEQTSSVMERRVKAARSPKAEQTRAAIARTRSRLAGERAQQVLAAARLQLAAMWGSDQAQFTSAIANLYALPDLDPIDVLTARLADSPDLLRYTAERRLHEAELQLDRARFRPSLTLTAGIRRLEESDDTALVAGVSLPLPLFDRQQGKRVESRSLIAKSEAEHETAQLKARALLRALHGELMVARSEVEVLHGELLPQAERALEQTRSAFERGRFSYLELASAQQDLLDTRGAAIEAAGSVHRLHTEIERLTGEPLTAAAPTR